MKKKMERLDDKLFQPLTTAQQKRASGAATQTATTLAETYVPSPDFTRDGDHE